MILCCDFGNAFCRLIVWHAPPPPSFWIPFCHMNILRSVVFKISGKQQRIVTMLFGAWLWDSIESQVRHRLEPQTWHATCWGMGHGAWGRWGTCSSTTLALVLSMMRWLGIGCKRRLFCQQQIALSSVIKRLTDWLTLPFDSD